MPPSGGESSSVMADLPVQGMGHSDSADSTDAVDRGDSPVAGGAAGWQQPLRGSPWQHCLFLGWQQF